MPAPAKSATLRGVHAYDVAVIGGGLIGLACALRLLERQPGLRLVVIEKEPRTAAHQSGRNSGVLHSGLYYRPDSLRARNCVRGREQLVAYARRHGIPHDVCGKLVVAATRQELPELQRLLSNGHRNGLSDVEMLDRARMREIEPHCAGVGALWVPYAGIIDYAAAAASFAEQVEARGSHIRLGCRLLDIGETGHGLHLSTSSGPIRARHLISCAGLQADRVARLGGRRAAGGMATFRGDFFRLAPSARHLVRNLIYPVPDPSMPFLGVHMTRTTHGQIECGPNAVPTFKREGYGRWDFNLRDTAEAFGYPGTWRLMRRHLAFGIDEYRRVIWKRAFLRRARRLIPALQVDDLIPARAGVRAIAMDRGGTILDDFRILTRGRVIHVLNAPSPAATACLSIGEQVAERAAEAGFLKLQAAG